MGSVQTVGEGFRRYFDRPESTLLVLGVALGLVIVGILLHNLFSSTVRVARNQRRIFKEFSGASALSRREEKILFRVALHCHLDNPSFIFVRRGLFETAVLELAIVGMEVESVRRKVYSA